MKNCKNLLVGVGVAALGATAVAQSEIENVSVTPSSQGLSGVITFDVPQFNPFLGTLSSIDLTLTPTFGNFGSQAYNYTTSPITAVGFTVSDPSGSLMDAALGLTSTWLSSDSLTSPNYTIAPVSLANGPALPFTFTTTPGSVAVAPSGFAGFTGLGYDDLSFTTTAAATSTGTATPGAVLVGSYGNVGGLLSVTYNFTPAVPEPSTFTLLLLPFAAAGLRMLRKSRKA
jgi:hypothetical protein